MILAPAMSMIGHQHSHIIIALFHCYLSETFYKYINQVFNEGITSDIISQFETFPNFFLK